VEELERYNWVQQCGVREELCEELCLVLPFLGWELEEQQFVEIQVPEEVSPG
jgi:hypothetical protein